MTILDKIIEHKRNDLQKTKMEQPIELLEKSIWFGRDTLSLSSYLTSKDKAGIIAEFKRKSPSKGLINGTAKVEDVVKQYEKAGVSGLSVLTNQEFFGGSNQDLGIARETVNIPILRKEFIIDEYQVVEAKAMGADAILLIAAVLDKEETKKLASLAKNLGLDVLFAKEELDKVNDFVDVVGVNNRNLKTFEVSIETSKQLFDEIPSQFVKISESGISDPENIKILKKVGFQGFLIGENFMKTADPGKACMDFVHKLGIFSDAPLE